MKYHIDTIPVWDAYNEETECPMCVLHYKSEESYVDSFLGGSVMEPATRVEVNDKGFCPHHNTLLYKAQNRLGLALITHTHMLKTLEKFDKLTENTVEEIEGTPFQPLQNSIVKKVTGRDKSVNSPVRRISSWLDDHQNRCIICDRIDYSLNRYAYTILHLWDKDPEFRKKHQESKGFCFTHLAVILNMASERFNNKKQAEFIRELLKIERQNLDRLEKELHWFTQKFDYQNQDKPWGNSKDSVQRILQKLTGKYME